ncbi:hypothetical protein R3P38DRAFT_167336 [Favolaschia claudopus]|uniref:Uncharacterized protein n=1 Tax=Favolaschia claudopus TaxID=2862362 RepID=A0AAW0D142_9AGAR
MLDQSTHEAASVMPTHRRALSPNELSYFLPSRADGLNDMFHGIKIHAPPSLISPLRVRIAWAIMRLRHSLLACRVEMPLGKYDEAEFVLRPPSSTGEAMAQAAATIRFFDDVTGRELMHAFLNGPRTLSSDKLSAVHIARHGEISPGTHEFHIVYMLHHMINDSPAMYTTENGMLELLGGSNTPGGPPRTDQELAAILDREWMDRCGAQRIPHDAIIPATEDRIQGLARSKFRDAAWVVDNKNIEKRFIGGHSFPRLKRKHRNMRWVEARFDVAQTKAIMAQCKAKRVTLPNVIFALLNYAWIRLCASRRDLPERKDLPMLMYTAISTRRYLKPCSALDSYLSLALEYHNVVLPAFVPRHISPVQAFWARGREAQRQMFRHSHSPLMLQRSVASGMVRGQRAKAWARIDDEADGTLPPTKHVSVPPPKPQSGPKPPPSLALLGITNAGDFWTNFFRPQTYPSITVQELAGMARKAPGSLFLASKTIKGRFTLAFLYDEPAFPPGMMEEFWRYVVDGVHEYVLEDNDLLGTAEEIDMLKGLLPFSAVARL